MLEVVLFGPNICSPIARRGFKAENSMWANVILILHSDSVHIVGIQVGSTPMAGVPPVEGAPSLWDTGYLPDIQIGERALTLS